MSVPPTLLIVTGLPGTGKSMLAVRLRRALGWPVFAKDVFKERLLDTLGSGDRAWSRRLSDVSFTMVFACASECLDAGQSCIVEGNFRRSQHSGPVGELIARSGARCVQVLCHADGELLVARFRDRAAVAARHPGHRDLDVLPLIEAELRRGRIEPFELPGPLLEFDTTRADVTVVEALMRDVLRLCDRAGLS